jgi:hypothetical protein
MIQSRSINHVRLFQPRFAKLIRQGKKFQTVRPVPKTRYPMAGDTIRLREWKEKPYRSKQLDLGLGRITAVCPVFISATIMRESGQQLDAAAADAFAKADGFSDYDDMATWFAINHALPFTGIVIRWKPF